MKKNQEQIAIYSRKTKFTDKGESISKQIKALAENILAADEKEDTMSVFKVCFHCISSPAQNRVFLTA